MHRSIIRIGLGIALFAALLATAPAQDKPAPPGKPGKGGPPKDPTKEGYREFFKTPETLQEFWDAMQFELEVGRPDIAALHLHGLLQLPLEDQQLVDLEQKVGSAAFLRLRLIHTWSKNPKLDAQAKKDADDLTTRVGQALEKILGNRDTILKHVKGLSGDREEHIYATGQLQHAGALAVPTLVGELQSSKGEDHDALMTLLPKLSDPTVAPLVAGLDIDDDNLRLDLIEVLMQRQAREAVPNLWSLTRSTNDQVRRKAVQALSLLTNTEPAKLSPAPIALTREAERYYRHQVHLEANGTIWRWDDKAKQLVKGLPGKPLVKPTEAEEYYGMRFARQALAIEPTYGPAQQVLLALVLDKAAERAGGPDKPLPKDVGQLLATINPDLVNQVLDQALTEQRLPVMLGAVRALGELGDSRALKPTGHGEPPLVRALSYPDRRVQMAAADALLRIPAAPSPTAAGRVVDVLSHFAVINPKKTKGVLLIGFPDAAVADAVERAGRQIGYDVEKVTTGKAMLQRLQKSADVDLILLSTQLPDPGLSFLLAPLRDDPSFGGLPLWLVVPWDTQENLKDRQFQVDQELRTFRRSKMALQDERERVNSLYLKSKGNAATPFKVRLDKIDRELEENYSLERENQIIAVRKAIERQQLTAPPAREPALRRLLSHYRNTWLLPESAARDVTFLRHALEQPPGAPKIQALTEAERKDYAERSLHWLARLAKGEVAGYDISPAADALSRALQSSGLKDDALIAAVEATARLPAARGGDRPQRELLAVITDKNRSTPVRVAAAAQLQRRIQQYSSALTPNEVRSLEDLRNAAGSDQKLRDAVAPVIGATRPGARLTGERLKEFGPKAPAPAPPPKEEKPAEPPKEDKP